MPGEDGIAFAKWVLERHPDVKIIFLTAYADVKYMKEAISMQSFEYVLQPVSSEELRSVVKRAISQIKIERKNLEMMNRGAFFSLARKAYSKLEPCSIWRDATRIIPTSPGCFPAGMRTWPADSAICRSVCIPAGQD